MNEWFYARGGQQNAPITFEQLRLLVKNGDLNPQKDLVWNQSMKDWVPAGQVPGLFASPPSSGSFSSAPSSDQRNENTNTTAETLLQEIRPGSEPIAIFECINRGFKLVCRNLGKLLLVFLVYVLCSWAVSLVLTALDTSMGWAPANSVIPIPPGMAETPDIATIFSRIQSHISILHFTLNQLFSLFLSLGLTRIGLDMIAGKEFSFGLHFKGGKQLLPLVGATLLFVLMVFVGFICLVIPGIYIALSFGHYLPAMVDRNLGAINSLKYSWTITTHNTWNLFLLMLMYCVISLAGILVFCVGILFAMPVIWLTSLVAYRWLQYGRQSIMDQPGTETPLLKSL